MTTDQEKKYREYFVKEFTSNPYYWNQAHLVKISEVRPREFEDGTTQSKWLWYLSACKKREEEIEKRDKLLGDILGVMKGRLHQEYDGEITITSYEYEQWLKQFVELVQV